MTVVINKPDTAKWEYEGEGKTGDALLIDRLIEKFLTTGGITADDKPTIYRIVSKALRLALSGSDFKATVNSLFLVLNDATYRAERLVLTSDPVVHEFWTKEFEALAGSNGGGGAALIPSINWLRKEFGPGHLN